MLREARRLGLTRSNSAIYSRCSYGQKSRPEFGLVGKVPGNGFIMQLFRLSHAKPRPISTASAGGEEEERPPRVSSGKEEPPSMLAAKLKHVIAGEHLRLYTKTEAYDMLYKLIMEKP